MSRTIGPVIAALAVAWCVSIGIWLWVRPWAPGVSFADISALGAVPLVVPVAIAALGAWGAWRQRWWPLVLSTTLMLLFVVFAGFSIGRAYIPAVAALGWALAAKVDSRTDVGER